MTDVDIHSKTETRTEFFVRLGIVFLVIAAIAFVPRYWVPLLGDGEDFPPGVHLHAAAGFLWIILFLSQAWLAKSARTSIHRTLGYLSVILAILFFVSGVIVSIGLMKRGLAADIPGSKQSLLINLSDTLIFGVLYFVGILQREYPSKHKRYMVLATIALMNASLFRIGAFVTGNGFFGILLAPMLVAVLVGVCMIRDKRQHGKVNRVFWVAGSSVLAIHIARIPLANTPVWFNIVDWIRAL